jgi:hypothetical protein
VHGNWNHGCTKYENASKTILKVPRKPETTFTRHSTNIQHYIPSTKTGDVKNITSSQNTTRSHASIAPSTTKTGDVKDIKSSQNTTRSHASITENYL